jgi:hypothetical protein
MQEVAAYCVSAENPGVMIRPTDHLRPKKGESNGETQGEQGRLVAPDIYVEAIATPCQERLQGVAHRVGVEL